MGLITSTSLYSRTGFSLLEDNEGQLWYYYKKYGILIPHEQEYISIEHKHYDFLPQIGELKVSGDKYKWSLLLSEHAKEVFSGLGQVNACKDWHIMKRVWTLDSVDGFNWMPNRYNSVYDGKEKNVRMARPNDKESILQCIYASKAVKGGVAAMDNREICGAMRLKPITAGDVLPEKPNNKKGNDPKNMQINKNSNMPKGVAALLECDKRRCRLEAYEESMLYDIQRGHWELYGSADGALKTPAGKMVPRDPRKDMKTGVIGIDFGTKSTVVVKQDGTNEIIPVRIGTGHWASEVRESDFENPTVIECTDLESFIASYLEREGRPQTNCDDFFISYDAFEDFRNCPPNEFYAYYTDLKQWANTEKENARVKDKKGRVYWFKDETNETAINPVELYAYYIGMYINNMRNGIYMKYLMSFPVGYARETREFILRSFEKGIKKSLPACILEDAECMKKFRVDFGISEPAAYAVTALGLGNLNPQDENDRYMYGIFDFGGGTTDFDFGIWRGASESEYEIEGYDYVLECFGADSDITLGGENILELLGYEVFKNNQGLAREKKLVCTLPFGVPAFLGSEELLLDSQIAMRNMVLLKEELRPLWHQENGWREKYRHTVEGNGGEEQYEEYLELTLYSREGKPQPNCRLVINTEELILLVRRRIQKGVDAFFSCMEKTFLHIKAAQKQDDKVYIFLAGNSSRSVFVRELFLKKIDGYQQKFKKLDSNAGGYNYFELIEPLKDQISGERYTPNAKTSVAYGLLKSREGSSIKVVKNEETNAAEQARFKYFLGRDRRPKFDCRLSPAQITYGEWVQFQGTAKPVIRIYYTTDPMADSKKAPLDIGNIPYSEINIEPKKDQFLFIRTCGPTVIEYAIAARQEEIDDNSIKSFPIDA